MAKSKQQQEEVDPELLGKMLDDFLLGQQTLKTIRGYTDDEMEAMYTTAYNLYTHGKHEDAKNMFSILCQFDQYESRYWMGLGACRHVLKNHLGAAEAYAMAMMFDDTNPVPAFHCADCLIHLGKKEEAIETLKIVVKFVKGSKDEKEKELLAQSQVLLKELEKKK